MTTRCSDTHYYTRDGLKVANGEGVYTRDGVSYKVVCGRNTAKAGEIHLRDLGERDEVEVGGVSLAVDPGLSRGRRARRAGAGAVVALARIYGEDFVEPFLRNLSENGTDQLEFRRGLSILIGRELGEEESTKDLVAEAALYHREGVARAEILARLRPTLVGEEVAPERISQIIDRSDPEAAAYYRGLDSQHFGSTATASNFTEFNNADEALMACASRRGVDGNDRLLLIALGCDPSALLGEDECRYLVFPAKGRLGVTEIAKVPLGARVRLTQEKPGVALSLVLTGRDEKGREILVERPEVDIATVVIGAEEKLWTMHPGLPTPRNEKASFEAAGFSAGEVVSVRALRDEESTEGKELRARFAKAGVKFPDISRVKVPLKETERGLPEWFKRTNYSGYVVADKEELGSAAR